MGSTKDYFFDIEAEKADEWVRDRLENKEADEESEEWQELANIYQELQDNLADQAEFEAELCWLKQNGSSILHKQFIEELSTLRSIAETPEVSPKYMIYRMSYAHAVTLLESFLGDTAKSLIIESDVFFKNALLNVDELKKAKYSLEDLALNNLDAKGLAVKEMSKILYHNIPKVKRVLEGILGCHIDVDIKNLNTITGIRHDIAHRNGRTIDGNQLHISKEDLVGIISHIELFSNVLQKQINNAQPANKPERK